MVMPPGNRLGTLGKSFCILNVFLKKHSNFCTYMVTSYFFSIDNYLFCHLTYIGPVRPIGFPRHGRRGRDGTMVETSATLESVRENLASLTSCAPTTHIEEMPERYQRQVVGVPRAWITLFRKLVTIVMFHQAG